MTKRNYFLLIVIASFLIFLVSRTNAQTPPTESLGDPNISSPDPVDESVVQGNGSKPGQNSTGAHVNTFTGDAWATATDFNYKRNGYPSKYERYFHNGITSPFGELGLGWMSNYDISLFVPMPNSGGDHALLVLPHQTWKFSTSDGGNTFMAPAGCFYQLQTVSGSAPTTYVLTDKFGNTSKFSVLPGGEPNIARLIEVDDLNGNKMVLSYETFVYFAQIENNYSGNSSLSCDVTWGCL